MLAKDTIDIKPKLNKPFLRKTFETSILLMKILDLC